MKYVVWMLKNKNGHPTNEPFHYSWRPDDINEAYSAVERILGFNQKDDFKFDVEVREWNE